MLIIDCLSRLCLLLTVLCFVSVLRYVHIKISGLLGTGDPGRPPRFSHSSCVPVGEREIIYLSLHYHHQNDFCIKMGSDERHPFNVSVIVSGGHKTVPSVSHNLGRERKARSGESNQSNPPASLYNALPLGLTGSPVGQPTFPFSIALGPHKPPGLSGTGSTQLCASVSAFNFTECNQLQRNVFRLTVSSAA